MAARINLFTLGGITALVYVSFTLFLYVYLWTRWSVLKSNDSGQILTIIYQNSGEWKAMWWGITIIPYALIPTFLAVLRSLWKGEMTISSMAFTAGMIALILGIIGPLRSATVTGSLANIHAFGNEAQKAAAQVMYTCGESYGRGLFCLFGAT
ncbi:MAG TPA: DUF4386 family protein [Candidatus Brocadiaceae bacterium]